MALVDSQADKCVVALSFFDAPTQPKTVSELLVSAGIIEAVNWPVATRLANAGTRVAKTKRGYVLSSTGRKWIETLQPDSIGGAVRVRRDLRKQLQSVRNQSVRTFVEEAVTAFENGLFRSAVVMSWLAAVHVLHVEVFANHRHDFDKEMTKRQRDWRKLKGTDDFGRMKEAEFLDRLTDISVINKTVKAELKTCLDRRNGCGHPNTYALSENVVAHHLEVLLLNIFNRFT
ncbi:MAG: hypothetical protein AAFY80_01445 [Pseudomonadota bacterium]